MRIVFTIEKDHASKAKKQGNERRKGRGGGRGDTNTRTEGKSLLKVPIKSGFAQCITVGSRKGIEKMHG